MIANSWRKFSGAKLSTVMAAGRLVILPMNVVHTKVYTFSPRIISWNWWMMMVIGSSQVK